MRELSWCDSFVRLQIESSNNLPFNCKWRIHGNLTFLGPGVLRSFSTLVLTSDNFQSKIIHFSVVKG